MMDIKQSFAKVTAWAKAHPWLAGGIGLGFVILVIWAIRNKGSSEASIDVAQESEEPVLDLGTGEGGSLLDSFTNASGGVTQAPPVYDAPVFDALPAVSSMQDSGYFNPGAVQEAFYQTPTESYNVAALTESIPILSQKSQQIPASIPAGTKAAAYAESIALSAGTGMEALAYRGDPGYSREAKPAAAKAVEKTTKTKTQTPTQKLGKGAKYTGWIGGNYYEKGYLAQGRPDAPKAKGVKLKDYTGSLTSYYGGSV